MAETLDKAALKALSADTRQSIIKMLLRRPYTASELSKILGKHVTTVTEHLNILESSGLVKKKDSTNKWIYYALTEKGEKLFKPAYYSWIVVFSISFVLVFTGFLRLLSAGGYGTKYGAVTMQREAVAAAPDAAAAVPTDIIAVVLVILGALGFGYLCYRIWKRKRFRDEMKMYVEYAVL